MFAYCLNNPVMNVDHDGQWSWGAVTDWLCVGVSAAISVVYGLAVFSATGSISLAVETSSAVFGGLNNLTNQIYYNYLAKPESSIETNTKESSYTEGYVSRWDRLNYTKQQTQSERYDHDAKLFFSEYSVHMYAWYATGWAEGKNIPVISKAAKQAKKADVKPHEPDSRWWVEVATQLWGQTGL